MPKEYLYYNKINGTFEIIYNKINNDKNTFLKNKQSQVDLNCVYTSDGKNNMGMFKIKRIKMEIL